MTALDRTLRNQGRGIAGALIVSGITVLTVETWWLALELRTSHLLVYAVVGLGAVLILTRSVGFRVEEQSGGPEYDPVRLGVDFAELVAQSIAAAFVVLFAYGVVTAATPAHVAARLGLVQIVPLGFGAALSNRLLRETEEEQDESAEDLTLAENVAVFAIGAVFFSLPLAASVEMQVLAATADWLRLTAIVTLSLSTAYLVLYELEFRGQSARRAGREGAAVIPLGQVCLVYAVALAVSVLLLWGFDHLTISPVVDVQTVVVLSFPATIGGAAARVIL